MKKKTLIIIILILLIIAFGGIVVLNKVKANTSFEYLKSAENCSTVSNYSQSELDFLNSIEAYYMIVSSLEKVSVTGSIYTFEAPSWEAISNDSELRHEFLTMYLEYLCENYPVPSSEYLSLYASNDSYLSFLESRGREITQLFSIAISSAPLTTYEIINDGDSINSIHRGLFQGFNYFANGADIEELELLMDELVANGTLSIASLPTGNLQASIDLTESVLAELELYGEGITNDFEGEAIGYIDLVLNDGEFSLSIDDYAIIMAKFEFIEANGNQLIENFTGLTNATFEELEEYAIHMEYEGYDDMLNDIIHTFEGAIGNGYYDTRIISGTYDFDGENITFHTENGVMNGVCSEGSIIMNLTVDGSEQELVFT